MQKKNVYPIAPVFLESTRSIGYSFESAVSDVIDNSISKSASRICVRFDSCFPMFLCIIDDGIGMDENEIIDAMRYGSRSSLESRDKDDLGRFGLGLKMASMSQCRQLTVVSKTVKGIIGAEWNLDSIEDWALTLFDENECRVLPCFNEFCKEKTGTMVIWRNFDRMEKGSIDPAALFDKKIEIARKHVALVFHRYLSPEKGERRISISFNGLEINAIDPFLLNNPATQRMEEIHIPFEGEIISVKPYILPFISKLSAKERKSLEEYADLKLNQGFYIYRNRRLIIWGTWLRLIKQEELKKLARVRIDIPNNLDALWDIDIKKSTASLPEDIKEQLKTIVLNATGRSEKVYRYRGRKATNDNLEHVWDVIVDRDSTIYKINRENDVYKRIIDSLSDENRGYMEMLTKMIETSFPFRDVYWRLAKSGMNDKSPVDREIDIEETIKMGENYLNLLMSNGMNLEEAFERIKKVDFLVENKEVIKRLGEIYGIK